MGALVTLAGVSCVRVKTRPVDEHQGLAEGSWGSGDAQTLGCGVMRDNALTGCTGKPQ